ncbi:hypothetical protein CBOM_08068 [Ceraceosorus bombacis]|uniref:Uncharacterized protein n=1 Tax=Ceraceosorus bombacis TaxID=401625 RepID=A0A0P1BSF0_9BASI|nr:hypothetical protein CBOM_08068 [Ceraceosorus bombacis]
MRSLSWVGAKPAIGLDRKAWLGKRGYHFVLARRRRCRCGVKVSIKVQMAEMIRWSSLEFALYRHSGLIEMRKGMQAVVR